MIVLALMAVLASDGAVYGQRGGQPARGGGGGRPAPAPAPRVQPGPNGMRRLPPQGPIVPQPTLQPRIRQNRPVAAPVPARPATDYSTLTTTAAVEGSLLVGMVLMGFVRLTVDRARQRSAAADAGQLAS